MHAISIAQHPDNLHVVTARDEAGILSKDGRIPPKYEHLEEAF